MGFSSDMLHIPTMEASSALAPSSATIFAASIKMPEENACDFVILTKASLNIFTL
jgi:hypothetical protein